MEEIKFERTDGVDAGHGHKFEWEMTTLAYLRCQTLHEQWKKDNRNGIKSFSVANNVKGAGKFDDIVIRVEYVVDSIVKNKVIFAQCKHIEDPFKNSEKRFQTLLAECKSRRDLFESFVKIEHFREQLLNDGSSGNPINTKQNIILQQDGDINNLRSFFGCKTVDTEFVFCSNIEIGPSFKSSIYKVGTESSSKEDIASILFNTANTYPFELRLKESVDAKASLGSVVEQNSVRSHFQEKFRLFLNQSEPETLIYEELHNTTNTFVAIDHTQTIIAEIRSHFKSKNPCTALTEKSVTVSNVGNFILIRTKSTAIMKDFYDNFGIQNIFSLETTSEFQKQLEQNEIINIKTDLLKLELIKVKQVFNSLPIECTCLFLHNKTDTEEWISARETSNYSNLKMVYICSLTNVNFDEISIKPNEIIVQILECDKNESALSEYLHQFSRETQNFILNAKLLIQGVQIDIKSFCGNSWKYFLDENTICDILQNKLIELYEPLPDLNFYIGRHFQSESLDLEQMKRKMLGWKSVNNGVILFSENDKHVPGFEATYKIFENMQDVRTFVQKFRSELQDTYHLCSYCDNEPKLIYSFGKLRALTVKNTMTQDSLLLDKHTKIKIISDIAGMGKSTTLLALAKRDKENNPSHLVFFMELNKYLKQLKNAKDLSRTDAAINFLGNNILNLEEVALRVFMNACKESGKVALYFDAFDEISPDAEKALPCLLLTLERTKVCRIYVSSRPNYVHVLEETMLQKSMQFLGLTDVEKERALAGFWKQLLIKEEKKVDEGVLKVTAKKIVHLLHKEGHLFNDILAIPLQIRMLATVYYESLKEAPIPELTTVNISELYEDFIRLHAIRFYVEKHNIQWNTMKDDVKCRFIDRALKGAEEVAFQSVITELLEYNEAKMCDVLSSLCDDLGLITNKNPPVFLHRTIAEYLAAKYVVTKLKDFDEEGTFCSIFIDERFNIVRKFIDSFLVGKSADLFFIKVGYQLGRNEKCNTPLHVATKEGNIEIMIFLLRCDQSLLNKDNFKCQTAIHIACEKSKIEAVKLLLTYSDCSVKERDNLENTPLHGATKSGSTEIIKMILRHDESLLNQQNLYGVTPLHLACEKENEAAAKFLLENPDCLVNLCDRDGDTSLHSAARRCSPEVIEMILRRDKSLLNKQNERGRVPLHNACEEENEAAVKFLLENPDCLVNLCDSDGDTVLHIAAQKCSLEVIEMILRRDKSLLNKQNERGKAPLHYACEEENEATVKFLLENPECLVDLCDSDGDTLLHSAARHCSPEVIEKILRRDKSLLNKQNERGETPLQYACKEENEATVKFLLENPECLLDLCDMRGDTVLHSAARHCSPEVIEMILRRDKSLLNKQNEHGETPFHYACEEENKAAVKFLLENPDCLVDLCDSDGDTVLHSAAKHCSPEIIEMILRRDKSLLNKQNKNGTAPLNYACYYLNVAAAKFLLELPECLINLCDSDGDTLLHSAARHCSPEVIKMILRRYKSLLNKQNEHEKAPLHIAFGNCNTKALNYLLSHNECVTDICDTDGNTVLHCIELPYSEFRRNYCDEIKIILQQENALINKQNNDGKTPLHSMLQYGRNEAKLLLAQTDCSVNICDKSNETALHKAVMRDNFKLVKIILQRENVLINQQNCKGKTALHLAASKYYETDSYEKHDKNIFSKDKPSLEIVKLLIAYPGCSINISDNNGLTALDVATKYKQQEIIEILQQHGAEYGNRTVEDDKTHSAQSVNVL